MHLVNDWVNKVAVGSGHRDVPKCTGEGVASCDPLVGLAGQKWVISHYFSNFSV